MSALPGSVAEPLKLMIAPSAPLYAPPALAVGAWLLIVAVVVAGADAPPSSSVTVTETVNTPSSKYVWDGFWPVPVVPSPNVHA